VEGNVARDEIKNLHSSATSKNARICGYQNEILIIIETDSFLSLPRKHTGTRADVENVRERERNFRTGLSREVSEKKRLACLLNLKKIPGSNII
jgi:hypothetical protein